MALRVILIGTGGVGGHALRALLKNAEYELTGVWVSSHTKAGKDVGIFDEMAFDATQS